MAEEFPVWNDNEIDLLRKIANNSGLIAESEAGDVASITAGTGISVDQPTGAVTITNTGVVSLTGTPNEIEVSAPTGAVTISLPAALTFTGKTITGGTFTVGTYSGSIVTSTTAFRAPNGTAAAPGYSFTNYTGTGIYIYAANELGFASNGAAAWRMVRSGSVNYFTGVGSRTDTYFAIGDSGDISLVSGGTNQNIALTPSGTGRVQVGTLVSTGVATPLVVSAGGTFLSGSSITAAAFKVRSYDDGGSIAGIGANGTGMLAGTTYSAPLLFVTNATERGRFSSGGNLLLGTPTDNTGRLQFAAHTDNTGGIGWNSSAFQYLYDNASWDFATTAGGVNTFVRLTNINSTLVTGIELRNTGGTAQSWGFNVYGSAHGTRARELNLRDNTNGVDVLRFAQSTGDATFAGSITVTNVANFADGTSSNPGIRFTNSTGSGLYHSGSGNIVLKGAGTVKIQSGGIVDAVTIDTSQNIYAGGTTAPVGGVVPKFNAQANANTEFGGFGVYNISSGTSAVTSIKLSNTLSDGTHLLTLAVFGQSFTTSGLNKQNYGLITVASALSGLQIRTEGATPLEFATNNTLGLALDSSQRVLVGLTTSGISNGLVQIQGSGDPRLMIRASNSSTAGIFLVPNNNTIGANTPGWTIRASASATPSLSFYSDRLAADAATLTEDGNAVFSGSVQTSAPTGGAGVWKLGIANAVSPTAPNRTVTIDIGGTTYYLAAKTTND